MNGSALRKHTLGWIGAGGRMGFAMAKRLLEAGGHVAVYNRTRSKVEPLAALGATIVDRPSDLADRDIVFTTVSASDDFLAVTCGEDGLLANVPAQGASAASDAPPAAPAAPNPASAAPRPASSAPAAPGLLIDCSTVSEDASSRVRAEAERAGWAMLSAPVSGNAKVVAAGKLTIVASGPRDAFDLAAPYLDALGAGSTYVGEGELARMVKICHNLMLGVVAQSLAEITVLAEKRGVPRHAFLEFMNGSVMGSMFTRYKTPAFVNLDLKPTFTPVLLRKDLDLGLAAGSELGVPLPLTQLARDIVDRAVKAGHTDCDFAVLLLEEAKAAGMTLEPENVQVDDGLH